MNNVQLSKLERRIRLSALLSLIALVGTGASLLVSHPLSFIEFAVVGLTLMLVAVAIYLLALVRNPRSYQPKVQSDGGG
jgi:hypothetical protein